MRHRVAGRKLGRTSEHRLALLRNLSTALFDKERITTTLMKAKELRPFAEKLITISKKETLHARRRILRDIHDKVVVAKLFDTLSPRYASRPGGYTRILRLGPRRGDNAEMAIIELVGGESEAKKAAPSKKESGKSAEAAATAKKTSKKTTKKTAKKAAKKTAKKAAKKADAGKTSKRKASTTKKKTSRKGKKAESGEE